VLQINGKSYVLLNAIGRGGSSKVYEAFGPDMKVCAVKCVNLEAEDENTIACYRNEISLLQRLQHCHQIVRLIDQYAFCISTVSYAQDRLPRQTTVTPCLRTHEKYPGVHIA